MRGARSARAATLRRLLFVLVLGLAGGEFAQADLLARVEPSWSPFAQLPVPAALVPLVEEARQSLAADPLRVAEVLSKNEAGAGAGVQVLRGLRADALYVAGGDAVFEAQRLYRELVTREVAGPAGTWARFMLGNIHKGLGFRDDAATAYAAAAAGAAGPWTPALRFNQAVLQLEAGRYREAHSLLGDWIRTHGDLPGAPLVLYLLGEAQLALGDAASARRSFSRAQQLDPEAWLVRPEVGHAWVRLLRDADRPEEAVALLDELAVAYRGTRVAAQARLQAGELWEAQGEVARAALAYATLLDRGATPEEAQEAQLRLALLGVVHAATVDLTEPLPAYRVFYRPAPTLEGFVAGRDPVRAQRALQGLALLARQDHAPVRALALLARAFQDYPESPAAGRAYDAFMDLLEETLAALLAAERHREVVYLYEALAGAAAWAPTRDLGPAMARAAAGYEGLGAFALAREVYEQLLPSGTRFLTPEQLRTRILRCRVEEGEPEAVRRWAELRPRDWHAQSRLARQLRAAGATGEAAARYRTAAQAARAPADRLRVLRELHGFEARSGDPEQMLAAVAARRTLWDAIDDPAERAAASRAATLVEGRLRFAQGQWRRCLASLGAVEDLGSADRLLLALAAQRGGGERSLAPLRDLGRSGDSLYGSLARLLLETEDLVREAKTP